MVFPQSHPDSCTIRKGALQYIPFRVPLSAVENGKRIWVLVSWHAKAKPLDDLLPTRIIMLQAESYSSKLCHIHQIK